MKKKNSATAALTPSRWKKISKRKKRKKNPACRLPARSNRNLCPFPRLPRPNPHHPLLAVVVAVSPKRKRKRPKRNRLRKSRQRRLPRKSPLRKKRPKNRPRKRQRRSPRRKARSAVKSAAGRVHLRYAQCRTAPNPGRGFSCRPKHRRNLDGVGR